MKGLELRLSIRSQVAGVVSVSPDGISLWRSFESWTRTRAIRPSNDACAKERTNTSKEFGLELRLVVVQVAGVASVSPDGKNITRERELGF